MKKKGFDQNQERMRSIFSEPLGVALGFRPFAFSIPPTSLPFTLTLPPSYFWPRLYGLVAGPLRAFSSLQGQPAWVAQGILGASPWFYGLSVWSRARPDLGIRLLMWPSRIGLRWTFFGPSGACTAVLYSLAPVPFAHSPACTGILSGAAQCLPSTLPLVCPCMVLRTNSSRLYPTCMAGLYGPVSDFT